MSSDAARKAILRGDAPDNLSVSGALDLSGCTGLTALPDNLSVSGELDLSGCTGLPELCRRSFRTADACRKAIAEVTR